MSVYKFRDQVFLNYKSNWFVWESAWEKYRPITSMQWTGTNFVIDDLAYTKDPMDSLYGYGSPQMKEVCELLSSKFLPETAVATVSLCIGPREWFRDRWVSLHPCAPRDASSWKRMIHGKHKTCRVIPARNKFTKRILH